MNKDEITESVLAEFTPVFKKMTETSPVIKTVYSMVNNGTHPAQVIESLSYQIVRLQAQLEATETYNGYPMRIQYVKTSPAPRATVDEVNSPEPVRQRESGMTPEEWGRSIEGTIRRFFNENPESLKRFEARKIELNEQLSEALPERDTMHICYYCGQMPPVTVFDNRDICGPCSDFLTLNK